MSIPKGAISGVQAIKTVAYHARMSVAPMMGYTDRHCRFLHRLISKHTLLYTEMITAKALLHGNAEKLLAFNPAECPLALQLGGADPQQLATAVSLGCQAGYDEINLNVGCPSSKVCLGRFGACLMLQPNLVADCVTAMGEASTGAEISVKCRLGVDRQDVYRALPDFIARVAACGVRRFIIHARKAWLDGLNPKQNRNIPPLNYKLVHQIKHDNPHLTIIINGGLSGINDALYHIERGLDGVMIGRAAYRDPMRVLACVDQRIFNRQHKTNAILVVGMMIPYIAEHLAQGGKLHHITRHMLGLFAHQKGARKWRRTLTQAACQPSATEKILELALRQIIHV